MRRRIDLQPLLKVSAGIQRLTLYAVRGVFLLTRTSLLHFFIRLLSCRSIKISKARISIAVALYTFSTDSNFAISITLSKPIMCHYHSSLSAWMLWPADAHRLRWYRNLVYPRPHQYALLRVMFSIEKHQHCRWLGVSPRNETQSQTIDYQYTQWHT